MGYLYNKVKEALGGAKFSNSHVGVISDWTPNGVKAIIITRSFIFVAYHVRQARVYNLDAVQVNEDLQRNGVDGALHNLLSQRQLSCLEEIYVDGVFQNYRGLMDIQGYCNRLLNEKSRLRFYGYVGNASSMELERFYNEARMSGNAVYSYALDSRRTAVVQYNAVDNKNWYKNYNLRPQYYKLDADKGQLSLWFRSSVAKIEEALEAEKKNMLGKAYMQIVARMVVDSYGYIEPFYNLMKLVAYLNKNNLFKSVSSVITNEIKSCKQTKYFTVNAVKTAAEGIAGIGKLTNTDLKKVLDMYKLCEVYDETFNGELTEDIIREMSDGLKEGLEALDFINLCERICLGLCELSDPNIKIKMILVCNSYSKIIPNGAFRSKMSMNKNTYETKGYEGYLYVIYGLCGFNNESIEFLN